jgi:hypothetical protein
MIITYLITRCHLDNPVKLMKVTSVFIKYLNYACKITWIEFLITLCLVKNSIQISERKHSVTSRFIWEAISRSCFHTLFSRVWISRWNTRSRCSYITCQAFLVDGNFEFKFYTFIRPEQEQLRKIQLSSFWQESNLRCSTPTKWATESSCRALTTSSCTNTKVIPMNDARANTRHHLTRHSLFTAVHSLHSAQLKGFLDGNLWLELDNCLFVTWLVRALHRNHRATGSIPARGPIVAFLATAAG